MSAKKNSYSLAVEPSGDTVVATATVSSWSPLAVEIRVWHPDIEQIGGVMKSRAERGDRDEFCYNATRFFELAESLGNRAMIDIMDRERRTQRAARWGVAAAAFLLGLLAMHAPAVAGLTAVLVVAAHQLVSRTLFATRTNALRQFFAYRERSYESRRDDYVRQALESYGVAR